MGKSYRDGNDADSSVCLSDVYCVWYFLIHLFGVPQNHLHMCDNLVSDVLMKSVKKNVKIKESTYDRSSNSHNHVFTSLVISKNIFSQLIALYCMCQ